MFAAPEYHSMPETIHCPTHGETERTYVCCHLTGDSAGLGFHCAEPHEENPFPDAWCYDCNLIFEAHDGWNDQSEGLLDIRILCSWCYERSRIRNSRTDVSFEDLDSLRWKCGSCEEWHYGACLDFGFDFPAYWTKEDDENNQADWLETGSTELPTTLLTDDICIRNGEDYFIRGRIELPIIGTAETFCWGVWGSLSRENFQKIIDMDEDPEPVELSPMFSWLSNNIDNYPETLNLKMYAHVQAQNRRPIFELELTEHPLSQEYHHGITPERVKEIMKRRLDLPEA